MTSLELPAQHVSSNGAERTAPGAQELLFQARQSRRRGMSLHDCLAAAAARLLPEAVAGNAAGAAAAAAAAAGSDAAQKQTHVYQRPLGKYTSCRSHRSHMLPGPRSGLA